METGPLGKRGLFLCGLRLSEQERLIHEDEKKIDAIPWQPKCRVPPTNPPGAEGKLFTLQGCRRLCRH